MKDMEREKFEDSWKAAFEKAEVSPPDSVWTNIELELEKEKGGRLRKRLLFYQGLAAASVVFAMAVGGAGYYYMAKLKPGAEVALNTNNVAAERKLAPREPAGNLNTAGKEDLQRDTKGDPKAEQSNHVPADLPRTITSERQAPLSGTARTLANQPEIEATAIDVINGENVRGITDARREFAMLPLSIDDRQPSPLYTPRAINVDMRPKQAEVDPVVAMMARLERREMAMRGTQENGKEDDFDEKLWTSVGFAAGSFNTVQSSPSSATRTMAMAAPIVDQETKASGYSYSMGVNVGTRLSERWVLQGGVNYLTHASQYTANNVVVTSTGFQQQRFRAATTNEIIHTDAEELSNKIVYSAPYNVNNSLRYLSIPMQAGYLLVDKTFGMQVNAGVATDLFLQNTVTPDSKNMDKMTRPAGSDSPYRTVNLSGMFGTEFSYRFADHYRVSVNPGIRYPFSTIYKSELGVTASPLIFDVGLRFRYIFH